MSGTGKAQHSRRYISTIPSVPAQKVTNMSLKRLAPRTVAALTVSALALGVAPAAAQAEEATKPKNIIYMIGDGMGYNHLAAANLYQSGQSRYMLDGDADPAKLKELPGEAVQKFEEFNRLSMTTYQHENKIGYDPEAAWTDHDWVNKDFTDSAAAGTAMATGTKTRNGSLGVDADKKAVQNTSEFGIAKGKAAGVVSSVPFSHATPAAWAAHNESRNNYHEIADEMIASDLNVVIGAGHPLFDDNHNKADKP